MKKEKDRKPYTYEVKLVDVPDTCKNCGEYVKAIKRCRLKQCKFEDKRC